MSARSTQSAYEHGHLDQATATLEQLIHKAQYGYAHEDLGLSEEFARQRAEAEIQGVIGRNICNDCERLGLSFAGKRVLDLGAGMGGLSLEMAKRGAKLVSLEPGAAWRNVAAKRLAAIGRSGMIGAIGERLPIAGESLDLIVSLQVLEHVQNPRLVIQEAYRVLKPGGYLYMSYENYLSFWEPHYRVRWFPLLPKPIGAAYLRAIGRNPQFLKEAVTYTTFPTVRKLFFETGFECMRVKGYRDALRSDEKTSVKWKVLKQVAAVNESAALGFLTGSDYARRTFRTAVHEFMRKPVR